MGGALSRGSRPRGHRRRSELRPHVRRSRQIKTDRRDARALAEACLLGAYRPAMFRTTSISPPPPNSYSPAVHRTRGKKRNPCVPTPRVMERWKWRYPGRRRGVRLSCGPYSGEGRMRAELIGPTDVRWARILDSPPHDVYHLPGYGPLYESDPRAEESALWVRFEDAELLMPLMLRPLPDTYDSSLPGARDATSPWGYPGPLLRGTISPTELEGFANCVITALADHRIATCFIRTNPLLPDGEALLGQLGVSVDQGAIALIELDRSKEEIWRGYDGERRRRVLRLREAGFVVRHDEGEDFEAFRTIYRATMQRVAASSFYMFDDAHFERLRNLLGPRLHLVCV